MNHMCNVATKQQWLQIALWITHLIWSHRNHQADRSEGWKHGDRRNFITDGEFWSNM